MWRQTPKQSLGGALGSVAHRYRRPRAAGWPPRPPRASQALRWRGTTDEGLPVGSGPTARSLQLARLEAVLFLAREPLSSRRLAQLAGLADGTRARSLAHQLRQFYNKRGSAFQVEEVAGGFQLLTRPKFSGWLLRQEEVPDTIRLSGPAMETLSVVAYRQPVLRADIESIRGVQCGEILRQLMERDLVRIAGRASELGRPFLYGTTRRFLQLFGLRHIDDLPRADQLRPGLQLAPESDPAEADESPLGGEGDAVANPPGERHDIRSPNADRGAEEEEQDVDSAADTTTASAIEGAEIPGTDESRIPGAPILDGAHLASGAPGFPGEPGATLDDVLPDGGSSADADPDGADDDFDDEYEEDDDAEYEDDDAEYEDDDDEADDAEFEEDDDDEYEEVEEGEEEDEEYEYVEVDDDEEEEGEEGDDDEYEYEDDDDDDDDDKKEDGGDDEELEGEWEEVEDDEAEDEEYDYEYDDEEDDDDDLEEGDDEEGEEYEDDDYEYEDDEGEFEEDDDDDADDTAEGGGVEWDDEGKDNPIG